MADLPFLQASPTQHHPQGYFHGITGIAPPMRFFRFGFVVRGGGGEKIIIPISKYDFVAGRGFGPLWTDRKSIILTSR